MNDRLKIEVPNQSLGGACPSFFLHTTVVLGWMGQFPSAASQAIYMRKQVGLRFPSDKTLRTLEHRRRLTRKTEEKLAALERKVVETFGAKSSIPLTGDAIRNLSNWEEWFRFADYSDVNLPKDFLPKTRRHIRLLARKEENMVQGFLRAGPDLVASTVYLLQNPFARMLCAEGELPTGGIIRAAKELKGTRDFGRFYAENPDLRHWHGHCVVSLLMSILAAANLEASHAHKTTRSVIEPMLPIAEKGKVVRPVVRLLKRWRSIKGKSVKAMSALCKGDEDEEDARRKWESWETEECCPLIGSIQTVLSKIAPNQRERALGEVRFQTALLLDGLYRLTEAKLPQIGMEERLRMFQTFGRHRRDQEMTSSPHLRAGFPFGIRCHGYEDIHPRSCERGFLHY